MESKKSETSAGACQAKDPETSKAICDRAVSGLGTHHLCIFHLEKKSPEVFKEKLLAEIESVNESGTK